MNFSGFTGLFMAALATAPPPEPQGGYYLYDTFAKEEPNSQQVYFYKQLPSRTQCDESDGTAGYTVGPNELTSYGVSWGAGISASGWIFAGFSVSKTETTGNIDLCTNKVDDEKKDVICIWKRVGHKSPQFLTRLQRKDCEVIFFEANTQSKTGSNIKWLALGTAQQIPTKCGPRTRTMLNTTNLAWYDECWIVGPEQDSWRPCPVSLT